MKFKLIIAGAAIAAACASGAAAQILNLAITKVEGIERLRIE